MRAAILILLSCFGVAIVAALMATPAQAQSCQITWAFEDGQPEQWAADGHTVVSGTLAANQGAITMLELSELQQILGTMFPIPSDGVSIGLDATLGGAGAVQLIIAYTDGMSTTATYDSNGTHTLNAVAGHFVQSLAIVSHSANTYDNIVLTAPCATLGPPTPTPWPTPQATSVFSSTNSGPGFQMPAALPLAPLTDTIDFDTLWDVTNFNFMASVVITFFNLENIAEFFSYVLPFIGVELSLRWAYKIIGGRGSRSEEV